MDITDNILNIIILGIVGGSVPGPILAAVFTEVLRMGFFRSMLIILRGLIAESIVAAFILTIISLINPPQYVFYTISFAGAAFLIYLAWKISRIKRITSEEKIFFTFSKIFTLTLLNGPFWVFWITICVPMAFELKRFIFWGPLLFLLCFEIGWLASTAVWAFLFSRFRQILIKPKFVPAVFTIMALILLYFGIRMFVGSIRFFVP